MAVASNSAPQHERKLLEGTGVFFSDTGQKIFHPHAKIININSEGLDTSKILYGVFTNVWEEVLWILTGLLKVPGIPGILAKIFKKNEPR